MIFMNYQQSEGSTNTETEETLLNRRLFLRSLGKWSGAAIAAAVLGSGFLALPPEARAGVWVNRRGGYGGGWVNRGGYGGGWINGGAGGGGWINRRGYGYGGGGAWINGHGYGSAGAWINRW
jgi:hypothetical protein